MNFINFLVIFSHAFLRQENDEGFIGKSFTKNDPQEEQNFPNIKIYDSIEEFNANLPETVTLLKTPNKCNVYLLGTAHFSDKSREDVANVIRNVRPKNVVLEVSGSCLKEIFKNK
jgi:hypothetical protein